METGIAAANSQAGLASGRNDAERNVVLIPGTQVQFSETEIFREQLDWVKPGCPTIWDCLKEAMPESEVVYAHGYHIAGENQDEFPEALEICKDVDLIILTLGEKFSSGTIVTMGEGVDAADINLPACQDSFIREAAKLNCPLIGIHFGGRPISSDTADQYLNAIIEAWNPAEGAGVAVTDALLGKYNPSGKMPVTTAWNAGQIPVYYYHPNGSSWHQGVGVGFQNYVDLPHEPRYYFGYGLSYTSFRYEKFCVNGENKEITQVAPDEVFSVSCLITNTGSMPGTEVVQLYFRDPYASVLRPVQQLQGFARVDLEPGQTKKVIFFCGPSQTAFLDRDMRWKIEEGKIHLLIGASSEDLRLRGEIYITENCFIEGKERTFFAEAVCESIQPDADKTKEREL